MIDSVLDEHIDGDVEELGGYATDDLVNVPVNGLFPQSHSLQLDHTAAHIPHYDLFGAVVCRKELATIDLASLVGKPNVLELVGDKMWNNGRACGFVPDCMVAASMHPRELCSRRQTDALVPDHVDQIAGLSGKRIHDLFKLAHHILALVVSDVLARVQVKSACLLVDRVPTHILRLGSHK